MNTSLTEIRVLLRSLSRSRAFTFFTVLSLALGIGVTSAMFTIIYRVLFKPLPYAHPDRLVRVSEDASQRNVSTGVFMDWAEHSRSFDVLCSCALGRKTITGLGNPTPGAGTEVGSDFLELLQVSPLFGRRFTKEEGEYGNDNHVLILTHQFWKERFGNNTNVIGLSLALDGISHRIVGVLPPRALFWETKFLVPRVITPEMRNKREWQDCVVYGRLKPTAILRDAERDLRMIKAKLQASYPRSKDTWQAVLIPIERDVNSSSRPMLLMLLGGALCTLFIGCLNVASLQLARATRRQKELAIRMAIGASRWKIMRFILTENLLLATLGGAGGVLLALWGLKVLAVMLPQANSQLAFYASEMRLDWHMLAFSLLLSILVGLGCGLWPAITSTALGMPGSLREAGRTSTYTGASNRMSKALIVGEVAIGLVLLVLSGLFWRSLSAQLHVPSGFDPDRILAMQIPLLKSKYTNDVMRQQFFDRLFEQVKSFPGVEAVASTTAWSIYFFSAGSSVTVEGRTNQSGANVVQVGVDHIRGSFAGAMGIRVLRGRDLTTYDGLPRTPLVCLVNNEMAKVVFPNEDPLGKRITIYGQVCQVVGVVDTIRHAFLHVPKMGVYVAKGSDEWETLVVRTQQNPLALVRDVKNAVLKIDPDQPIDDCRSAKQELSDSFSGARFLAILLRTFAGFALWLTAIGLYGVVSYDVARQSHEMGIRLALGARRVDVHWLVLKRGLYLTLIGILIGLMGLAMVEPIVRSQLYGVTATDPATLVCVVLVLCAVALLACWLPARKASMVDPMAAIRQE